jgi:chloramphenicol 3-O-phosphotransferase
VGSRGMSLTSSAGLKLPRVALGVGDLIGQTVEVRRQGRRLQDGLTVLDALYVALVGVLV